MKAREAMGLGAAGLAISEGALAAFAAAEGVPLPAIGMAVLAEQSAGLILGSILVPIILRAVIGRGQVGPSRGGGGWGDIYKSFIN